VFWEVPGTFEDVPGVFGKFRVFLGSSGCVWEVPRVLVRAIPYLVLAAVSSSCTNHLYTSPIAVFWLSTLMFINSKTICKHLGLTAGNGLLADVQLMRISVRVLKVSVVYLSTIRYATIDQC
jgi:hypothetical protein